MLSQGRFFIFNKQEVKMNQQLKQVLDTAKQIATKGDPIILTGATGSGKSTSIEALAISGDVQALLSLREAQGKGSISQTNIVITDFPEIPEDNLVVTAKLCPRTNADLMDDNVFLGNILYTAKKKTQTTDEKAYKENLARLLNHELEHPSNDTLAYRLRQLKASNRDKLLDTIYSFPFEIICLLYEEAYSRNNPDGKNIDKIFTRLLTENKTCESNIKVFWDTVVNLVNEDMRSLKSSLADSGAEIKDLPNGICEFSIVFSKNDIETDIAKKLLNPAHSDEYLLTDTTLIFRGDETLFANDSDFFTVLENTEENKKIHCIRLIDTMGLFHKTETSLNNETERIIDTLAKYHSNKAIFVINAFVSDTAKKNDEALDKFFTNANRDISTYFLYTHWDSYLSECNINSRTTSKFSSTNRQIDWSEVYSRAEKGIQERQDTFKRALEANNSKKKPAIKGFYSAAIISDNEAIDTKLQDKAVSYPEAWHRLFTDILKEANANKAKYRVKGFVQVQTTESKQISPAQLYANLINCKGKILYASTVRACIRKWCEYGTKHESHVDHNNFGYQNITTTFVQDIRNYFLLLSENVNVPFDSILTDYNDSTKFEKDLRSYFKLNQNLGRKAAELIGIDAYENEFNKNTTPKYYYTHFNDMLEYVQNEYFPNKNTLLTKKGKECLEKAIEECIRDFIDEKCIVVY